MIFFISKGQIGNQLFQYAFLETIRGNETVLTINMNAITTYFSGMLKSYHNVKISPYIVRRYERWIHPIIKSIFIDTGLFGYVCQQNEPSFFSATYTVTKGILPLIFVNSDYFQSESFFDPRKFGLKIRDKFIEQAERILSNVPVERRVFIHVRRRDYLKETFRGEVGIALPYRYYQKAVKTILRELHDPFFIILTDDPVWASIHFHDLKPKYLSCNSVGVDLALMSLCQYGIVANSSFSWWGAYFMKNKKKVIFPKYWYGWKQKVDSHENIQPSWGQMIDVN